MHTYILSIVTDHGSTSIQTILHLYCSAHPNLPKEQYKIKNYMTLWPTSISLIASFFPFINDETRNRLWFKWSQCDSSNVFCDQDKTEQFIVIIWQNYKVRYRKKKKELTLAQNIYMLTAFVWPRLWALSSAYHQQSNVPNS